MNTARIDFTQPLDPAAPRLRHTFDTPSALLVAHALHEVRGVLQAVHAAAQQGRRHDTKKKREDLLAGNPRQGEIAPERAPQPRQRPRCNA